jgi:hypothetical protein
MGDHNLQEYRIDGDRVVSLGVHAEPNLELLKRRAEHAGQFCDEVGKVGRNEASLDFARLEARQV